MIVYRGVPKQRLNRFKMINVEPKALTELMGPRDMTS